MSSVERNENDTLETVEGKETATFMLRAFRRVVLHGQAQISSIHFFFFVRDDIT